MKNPIYLDYAATTPVDNLVADEMLRYIKTNSLFGNPSSNHVFGFKTDAAVEKARNIISEFLGCKANELIFTSGATESNNLAIKGVARANKDKGNHLITALTEHKAVLDACRSLEQEGFNITYLEPDVYGRISPEVLESAITPETILVSIMHVNNETGVIQDIVALGNLLAERNIFFHVDAVQSVGKLPISLSELPIDGLSFSSHKIYGPKGIGGLFLRRRSKVNIEPIITGGGQEYGIRPGTLPTHQIMGLAKAIEIASQKMSKDFEHVSSLSQHILKECQKVPDIEINGSLEYRLPNIINLSFIGVDSVSLITSLQHEVAISSGSACTSGAIEPSHVIKAMGIKGVRLDSAVRISIGRYSTLEDIDNGLSRIIEEVDRIRKC